MVENMEGVAFAVAGQMGSRWEYKLSRCCHNNSNRSCELREGDCGGMESITSKKSEKLSEKEKNIPELPIRTRKLNSIRGLYGRGLTSGSA